MTYTQNLRKRHHSKQINLTEQPTSRLSLRHRKIESNCALKYEANNKRPSTKRKINSGSKRLSLIGFTYASIKGGFYATRGHPPHPHNQHV